MLKPIKKINENAVKKDFFKIKKNIVLVDKIEIKENTSHNFCFQEVEELYNVSLPNKNQTTFIKTKKSRSIVDFCLNKKNIIELYLFCSRLDVKSFEKIQDKNIQGVGLSDRVLEKTPGLYKKVSEKVKVKLKRNHSKMLIFKTEKDFYVITGSGNASINSRIESYILENNEKKYNVIKNFFENVEE